jgi:hypothetical protein
VGTVSNPTGTVKRIPLAGLIDAGTYAFSGYVSPPSPTVPAQWQFATMVSDHPDVCGRQPANGTYQSSEIILELAFVGWADLPNNAPVYPPLASLPLVFQANGAQLAPPTPDGVHRSCTASVMQATKQGNAGNSNTATSGTVTITRMDAGGVEGSWDFSVNGDHASGSFATPWCGTPPA